MITPMTSFSKDDDGTWLVHHWDRDGSREVADLIETSSWERANFSNASIKNIKVDPCESTHAGENPRAS